MPQESFRAVGSRLMTWEGTPAVVWAVNRKPLLGSE